MQVIEVGDRVRIVGGGLYLGKWLTAGATGTIESQAHGGPYWWVKMDEDSQSYVLAPGEFEVIEPIK